MSFATQPVRPPTERPFLRPRTLPQQIADHLGMAILKGDYADGERIGEQEVAERYGVSRGPVREAIRLLETRGIVRLEPRRGATAVGISLDAVADLFNTRAALLGMAGRCFTRCGGPDAVEQFAQRLAHLRSIAPLGASDAIEFAHATGRAGAAIYNHCGNATLVRLLREQGEASLWSFIWREWPADYANAERRAACIDDYTATEAAARNGDEAEAEARLRKVIFESRDAVLKALSQTRGGSVDPGKLLR
jgi:DNA-binding GntR family transcriptional regulator